MMALAAGCQEFQLVEIANRFSSLANSAPTHASPGFSTLRHPFRYSRDVLVGCVVLLPRRF